MNNTLLRGNHTLNFGGEFRILANNVNLVGQSSGNFNFSATLTSANALSSTTTSGDGFASFLLGYGGGTVTHNIKTVDTISHYYAVYLQDNWRATSKLTFNLGLRYDLSRPRTERHDRATWFDPSVPSPLTGYSNMMGGLVYPGVNGSPRAVTNGNNLDFNPRAGFAYHPFSRFAIQGAAGIFFINNPNQSAQTLSNVGFRSDTTYNGVPDGVDLIGANSLSDPFPNGFVPITGSALGLMTSTGSSIASPVRHQPAPYLEAWNLSIGYQLPGNWLITTGYVGNYGRHLVYNPQVNQLPDSYLGLGNQLAQSVPNPFYGQVAVPGVLSGKTVLRRYTLAPYPQFTSVTLFRNAGAISNYNSLQTGLQKAFSKKLTLRAYFTLAKSMDDDNQSGTYQDASISPFSDGYSLSAFDQSHVFVGSALVALPFGRGQRFGSHFSKWQDALFGGYQINGIYSAANGVPLALAANNVAGIGNPGERPNWNGQRSDLSGRVRDRLDHYFATENFSQPIPYSFGNTSRFISLRAPGRSNLDVSAFKTVALFENVRLQVRFEAFNALNTVVFAAPGNNVSNVNFGHITGQANVPRQLQLGAKLLF